VRRWVSGLAAALILSRCGAAPQWVELGQNGTTAGGVALRVISSQPILSDHPFEKPPAGYDCVSYTVEAAATDGGRHELRPEQFTAGAATPATAVGRCDAPQMEPTWIGSQPVLLPITVVLPENETIPKLSWRP
jgi:hypothetical protein